MSIAAQYLVTAVIGVKGTNVTYDRSTAGSPATRERTRSGRTRLSIRWCETLSGLENAQPRAPPGGGRWRGTDAPSLPTLRGRRVSSRPGPADPADPAGALAAVIAERQQHTSIPGPGGARRSSGPACRSPRSGRRANLPGTDSRRAPPIGDGA